MSEGIINQNAYQDRFKDAPFFDPSYSIIIGGLGGIGSNVSYNLCRQNYDMYLYDMDTVEAHNIGSQMYGIKNIGENKAEVAKTIAQHFGHTRSIHCLGKFTEDSLIDNIVFSCFDNMTARKLMFNKWKEHQLSKTKEYRLENPNEVNIFIDGRMVAEGFQIYSVKTTKEVQAYEASLFEDSEVEPLPCSYKATAHTGCMIGSMMVSIFLNHVVNKKIAFNLRDTPFYLQYDNPIMCHIKMNVNEYLQHNKLS
jgi:hypothetical protein